MKEFLRPTKIKIITTILLMFAFIIGERMIYSSSEFSLETFDPTENLFFKFKGILFMPVYIITYLIKTICLFLTPESFENYFCLGMNSLPMISHFKYFTILSFRGKKENQSLFIFYVIRSSGGFYVILTWIGNSSAPSGSLYSLNTNL